MSSERITPEQVEVAGWKEFFVVGGEEVRSVPVTWLYALAAQMREDAARLEGVDNRRRQLAGQWQKALAELARLRPLAAEWEAVLELARRINKALHP